jgi:hypothetical protein
LRDELFLFESPFGNVEFHSTPALLSLSLNLAVLAEQAGRERERGKLKYVVLN